MWLFLLLFLVSPISASVFGSSESSPTEEISNLDADPEQNGAIPGMQDYGKVIRPTKKILLLGGYMSETLFDGMVLLDADRSEWIEPKFKLPYKAGGSCAVYFNEEIYLFGGEENLTVAYKLNKNLTWIRLADMNIGREAIMKSCLEWNGYIWIFGGQDKEYNYLKSVERYDPKTDKWAKMPRAYAAALLWNDRIIITGGIGTGRIWQDSVESFNLGRWMKLDRMPRPLSGHALVYYQNMTTILGGWNGQRMTYETVLIMDPQEINTTWRELSFMRDSSAGLAGIVLDEEIYAIGGLFNSTVHLDRVEIFDGDCWSLGPSLPYKWYSMSSLIIPQNLADRLIAYKP